MPELIESQYNCLALNNLGNNCYIFNYNHLNTELYSHYISTVQKLLNYFINPDFILYLYPEMLPQESNHIKYGAFDISHITQLLKLKNFDFTWISYYDGFIVYGDNKEWFNEVMNRLSKPNLKVTKNYLFDYYPSMYATEYKQSNKTKLLYSGSNWDERRGSEHYKEIYKLLDHMDYFEVYGPERSWGFLKNSYQGMIIDPRLIQKMQEAGIAMLFHSDSHLEYGIPSKRIFEAASAGNVIISDKNPFIIREFGDCVYYIDPDQEPQKVADDIDAIVQLVRKNPKLANTKAKCVHDIFMQKFSLEDQWRRVIEMHEKILNNRKKL
jgi:hypothetical protein